MTVRMPGASDGRGGRGRGDIQVACSLFAITGRDPAEKERVRRDVRQQIAFYASTRTYEPVLAAHGWQDLVPHLHRKSVEGDWKGMAGLVTHEMLDTYAVTATYEDLHAKILER